MSKIDELYKFVNERNLEMHVFRKETYTRIIILLPDGAEYSNGSRSNMEICEADDKDADQCAGKIVEQIEKRYEEIMKFKKERHKQK